MHDDFMDNGTRESRARFLLGSVLILFGILTFRLYLLQIADWEQYQIQSEKNTMQPVPIEASRGLILDRNEMILVDNRPSYTISVIPPRYFRNTDLAKRNYMISRLSKIVGRPEEEIHRKLLSQKRHFYEPVKLKRDINFETVSVVEEARYDLPGVEIQIEARRGYPAFNREIPLAPHILGYVGLIEPNQYPQMASRGYSYDDQIGKRGIERLCELRLRGREGVKYIEVNARGQEVGNFPDKTEPPMSGKDIVLTLDWRLQLAAEESFGKNLNGSLVALEPETGEILALVSKPSFHPRSIRDPKEWKTLQSDPHNPLLNRSIQGAYPPGSVLKMVAAIAALEMDLLTPNESRFDPCEGELAFGDRVFRCHRANGHGELTLREALLLSCDIFFYHLGLEVGIVNWTHYAKTLGFGQPTGIDLALGGDGEVGGLLPDRKYYEKEGKWFEGVMLNLVIGQGETLTTPIQIARYMAALSTGRLPHPFILKNNELSKNNPFTREALPDPIPISTQTLKQIRSILQDVVENPLGTGRKAHIKGIKIAGKTGTAQNPHGDDHAWFTAFAPVNNPQIALAILVENAGQGGEIAAPIARKFLKTYFEILPSNQKSEVIVAKIDENLPPVKKLLQVEPISVESQLLNPSTSNLRDLR